MVLKKITVEQCLTVDINKYIKAGLLHRSCGELQWCWGEKEIASVSYTLKDIGFRQREPIYVLTLHPSLFRRGRWVPVTQDIPLLTTQLYLGGIRYWFSCPECGQRVGKLHLPHGGDRFLCRNCYDLTYESCQECHRFDWFFAQMGIPPKVGMQLLKRD